MKRISRSGVVAALAVGLVLALFFVVGSPASAAPLGQRVLHRDFALLPYIEQDNLFALTLVRKLSGAMLLLDSTDGMPVRTTPLGFIYPSGSTWGSYTSSSDRHAYGAFSRTGTIRVVDLGDLSVPGPLAPVVLDSIELGAGFNPASTRMGIIAILIGLLTEQRPAVFYVEDGQTFVLGFDGTEFRPVGLIEDQGIWFFL
jgi:hypothetical protein